MPDDTIVQVKRRDRAVTDETWLRAMLHKAPFGTLATVCEGQPFAKPSTYAYDESAGPKGVIYLHGARAGRTRANVEHNDRVCFTVAEMGRLIAAPEAGQLGVEYASVMAFGCAAVVTDEDEARRALEMLVKKYFPHLRPGEDYAPATADEVRRTLVYRIDIEAWSGKQRQVSEDFPGTFNYGKAK